MSKRALDAAAASDDEGEAEEVKRPLQLTEEQKRFVNIGHHKLQTAETAGRQS
jgi:hypothetical protein